MKLISVQSRGNRLVKVWEVDYIGFQVSWKQIEVGLRGFVFMGYANYPEVRRCTKQGCRVAGRSSGMTYNFINRG